MLEHPQNPEKEWGYWESIRFAFFKYGNNVRHIHYHSTSTQQEKEWRNEKASPQAMNGEKNAYFQIDFSNNTAASIYFYSALVTNHFQREKL